MIRRVQSGGLTQRELDSLYDNVAAYAGIEEVDREQLLDEVITALRSRFPAAAKRRFGAKDQFARELLSAVFEECARTCDLSGNRVLNKVKTGGDMMAGNMFVDVYISYKNQSNRRVSLDIRQHTADVAPVARVQDVIVGGADGEAKEFTLEHWGEATAMYLSKLRSMTKPMQAPADAQPKSPPFKDDRDAAV